MEAQPAAADDQNAEQLVYPLFSSVKLDDSPEVANADNPASLAGSPGKVAILQKYNPVPSKMVARAGKYGQNVQMSRRRSRDSSDSHSLDVEKRRVLLGDEQRTSPGHEGAADSARLQPIMILERSPEQLKIELNQMEPRMSDLGNQSLLVDLLATSQKGEKVPKQQPRSKFDNANAAITPSDSRLSMKNSPGLAKTQSKLNSEDAENVLRKSQSKLAKTKMRRAG